MQLPGDPRDLTPDYQLVIKPRGPRIRAPFHLAGGVYRCSESVSQHENENERQAEGHDDPRIAPVHAIGSSLGNGSSRNVVPQPQKPGVRARRSWQSGFPYELDFHRIQESARA